MVHAKNYETVSKFVKVMSRMPWPLFFQTRCRYQNRQQNSWEYFKILFNQSMNQ